jgi:hypothetical protein
MPLVERCCECDELVPRCRCRMSTLVRILEEDRLPPELRPENKGGWNLGD